MTVKDEGSGSLAEMSALAHTIGTAPAFAHYHHHHAGIDYCRCPFGADGAWEQPGLTGRIWRTEHA